MTRAQEDEILTRLLEQKEKRLKELREKLFKNCTTGGFTKVQEEYK